MPGKLQRKNRGQLRHSSDFSLMVKEVRGGESVTRCASLERALARVGKKKIKKKAPDPSEHALSLTPVLQKFLAAVEKKRTYRALTEKHP